MNPTTVVGAACTVSHPCLRVGGEWLTIEDARAMVTGPEVADVPVIAAIVEFLAAFDEATS